MSGVLKIPVRTSTLGPTAALRRSGMPFSTRRTLSKPGISEMALAISTARNSLPPAMAIVVKMPTRFMIGRGCHRLAPLQSAIRNPQSAISCGVVHDRPHRPRLLRREVCRRSAAEVELDAADDFLSGDHVHA